MIKKWLNKSLSISIAAYKEEVAFKRSLFLSGIFFLTILVVFQNLWQQALTSHETISLLGLDPRQIILYLVFSQIIIASTVNQSIEIMNEVKSGSIITKILLPIDFIHYSLFRMVGKFVFRCLYFSLLGFFILAVHHAWPLIGLFQLLLFFLSLLFGILIDFFIKISIGISSFWFEDITALNWLYHKLLVFLGGAVAPITFFPEAIQKLGSYLPFQYVIYLPTKIFILKELDPQVLSLIVKQFGWLAVVSLMAGLLYFFCKRKLQIQGG